MGREYISHFFQLISNFVIFSTAGHRLHQTLPLFSSAVLEEYDTRVVPRCPNYVSSAGLAGIHYPKNESQGRRTNSGWAWHSVFMNMHEKITSKNISSGCLEEQLKYKEYIPPQ